MRKRIVFAGTLFMAMAIVFAPCLTANTKRACDPGVQDACVAHANLIETTCLALGGAAAGCTQQWVAAYDSCMKSFGCKGGRPTGADYW